MTAPTVLVTGATGNLGRAFRATAGDRRLVLLASPRSTGDGVFPLDITREADLATVIERMRPEVIVHLASIVGGAAESDPGLARRVNTDATRSLARVARDSGVRRIVFASTAAVYGDRRQEPLTESATLEPSGVYGRSKADAEATLLESATDGFAVDVLRIFNVYGPGLSGSLVNRLRTSREEEPVALAGLDGFVRDYVHAADVADALWAAADSEGEGPRVLNVGRGVPVSNRELVAELSAGARLHYTVGAERQSYSCADVGAIASALDWRAKRGLLD